MSPFSRPRRSITQQDLFDLVKAAEKQHQADKRECPRFSPGWHRADAALKQLKELKQQVRAHISAGGQR